MLSIKENLVETDDASIFQLMVDYTMISDYVYGRLADELGEAAARDFMQTKLTKMVSEVRKEE